MENQFHHKFIKGYFYENEHLLKLNYYMIIQVELRAYYSLNVLFIFIYKFVYQLYSVVSEFTSIITIFFDLNAS